MVIHMKNVDKLFLNNMACDILKGRLVLQFSVWKQSS